MSGGRFSEVRISSTCMIIAARMLLKSCATPLASCPMPPASAPGGTAPRAAAAP
jgi:hypothetical protein